MLSTAYCLRVYRFLFQFSIFSVLFFFYAFAGSQWNFVSFEYVYKITEIENKRTRTPTILSLFLHRISLKECNWLDWNWIVKESHVNGYMIQGWILSSIEYLHRNDVILYLYELICILHVAYYNAIADTN